MKAFFALLFALSFSTAASAQEPDFYLIFNKCKIVVSQVVSIEGERSRDIEGDTLRYGCYQEGKSVRCVQLDPQQKMVEYIIDFQSDKMFYLKTPFYADFIVLNLASHAAALQSRILTESAVGVKICTGAVITDAQLKEYAAENKPAAVMH